MFTVYVDDSGTHKSVRIVSAACCVASVKNWNRFERKWNAIGEEEAFDNFHMCEFAACRPDDWCRECVSGKKTEAAHPWRIWSEQKRERVITKLAETVNKYADYGMGIAIAKKNYEDFVLKAPLRDLVGEFAGDRHYTFAVQYEARSIENGKKNRKKFSVIITRSRSAHNSDRQLGHMSLARNQQLLAEF